MKRRTRVVMQLAALCFVLAAYGFAADDAYLYIVHGIPGRDIAESLNPGFPIDVLVNGESCLERGLAFGTTSGPLSFSPGTYDVQISEANTLAPCTNPSIITAKVALPAGANVTAVAAISGGEPTLLQFADNLTPVTPGYARFVLVQSADAGALQATLTQLGVKDPKTFTVTARSWQAARHQRARRNVSRSGFRLWQHDCAGVGANRLSRPERQLRIRSRRSEQWHGGPDYQNYPRRALGKAPRAGPRLRGPAH